MLLQAVMSKIFYSVCADYNLNLYDMQTFSLVYGMEIGDCVYFSYSKASK